MTTSNTTINQIVDSDASMLSQYVEMLRGKSGGGVGLKVAIGDTDALAAEWLGKILADDRISTIGDAEELLSDMQWWLRTLASAMFASGQNETQAG